MSIAMTVCVVVLIAAWFPAMGRAFVECDDADSGRNDASPSSGYLAVFVAAAITLAAALCGWTLYQSLQEAPSCPPYGHALVPVPPKAERGP